MPAERRVAITPQSAAKLVNLGVDVLVEAGLGSSIQQSDGEYLAAGATLGSRAELLAGADLLLSVQPPSDDIVASLKPGAVLASFLDPFFNPALISSLAANGASALCMELIPRTSYAQKLDALSSQASLGGYAAVILAAQRSMKTFPMMSTPAGTISPARVFVVGVGVAGLQAIATAKRLGARVEAYDTRPVVKEQVQSLGARFVELDVGETGQTEQGYAKELTEEQLAKQRQQMAKVCAGADVVITTAQLFGRKAPRIIDAEMVAGMKPGSVIVDMAAATGGNVEGTVSGRDVVTANGVTILGPDNLPAAVALDASQMYANNLFLLIEHAWDADAGTLRLDSADDIIGACLLTHGGVIRDERVRAVVEAATGRPA